jgi:hypothetical protein
VHGAWCRVLEGWRALLPQLQGLGFKKKAESKYILNI